jgi:hypothetical protein
LSRSTWYERGVWSTDQRLDQQPIPARRLRMVTTVDGSHAVTLSSHDDTAMDCFTSFGSYCLSVSRYEITSLINSSRRLHLSAKIKQICRWMTRKFNNSLDRAEGLYQDDIPKSTIEDKRWIKRTQPRKCKT